MSEAFGFVPGARTQQQAQRLMLYALTENERAARLYGLAHGWQEWADLRARRLAASLVQAENQRLAQLHALRPELLNAALRACAKRASARFKFAGGRFVATAQDARISVWEASSHSFIAAGHTAGERVKLDECTPMRDPDGQPYP